jgi:hypothetical protein
MKKLSSCILILIFAISCSPDNDDANSLSHETVLPLQRVYVDSPANPDNNYDRAGQLHNEILEAYTGNGAGLPSTVSGIITKVETTANANTGFLSIKGQAYQQASSTRVQYLLANQSTAVSGAINSSGLSSAGKASLSTFTSGFFSIYNQLATYESLYNYITVYESAVIADQNLTTTDKRIILTSTSVTRHSSYYSRKRPKKNTDPEWDLLIGNIAGAIEGSVAGSAEAITLALATGIAENQ